MGLNQVGDPADGFCVIAEPAHDILGNRGAGTLVSVKVPAAVTVSAHGGRFADVMQQAGEPQVQYGFNVLAGEDRVKPYVMRMVFVLDETVPSRQLGQYDVNYS